MKTSKVNYLGNLRTEAIHLRSNEKIITDAPVDNKGKGEAFSPTDLTATSLATCMLTTMAIVAQNHQIDFGKPYADVLKVMANDPRRIIAVEIDLYMHDHSYNENDRGLLEHTALTCPVSRSLHPDLEQIVRFHWEAE